jgi:(p)ppGpp synthase/HD superfamily hydrolase
MKDCLLLILEYCKNNQTGIIAAQSKLLLDSHYPGWDKNNFFEIAANAAKEIAAKVHCNQKRWDGSPYTTHTTAVANCFSVNDIRHAVGHLHDVIEDGDNVNPDWLCAMLDTSGVPRHITNEIVGAVDALSRLPNEHYVKSITRVLTNKIAIDVKLADLAHNLSCDQKNPNKQRTDKYLLARFILLHAKSFQSQLEGKRADTFWQIFRDAIDINNPLGERGEENL